ncbi:MAG: hypothetical protein DMF65_00650, partial [Acidobacteria bacterium]
MAAAASPSPTPDTSKASSPTPSPAASPSSSKPATAPAAKSAKAAVKGLPALPPEKAGAVTIPRLDAPPVIDGKLDDAAWKKAVVLKDFYQINPGDNTAPTMPTEVFVGYDAKFLYLGFHCFDDPSKVRATVTKRDNVLDTEDSVRVLLDTFNDQRKAYVLAFNPLGIQQDGVRTEGMGVDFSVDIVMESKGAMTSDGYTVEVAIPFKSLRYEAGKGKQWGLQVFRIIQRLNGEQDSWMPISRDVSGLLNQAGHITGLEDISTERTIELIPSFTVSETGKHVRTMSRAFAGSLGLADQGTFVNQPIKVDPGL